MCTTPYKAVNSCNLYFLDGRGELYTISWKTVEAAVNLPGRSWDALHNFLDSAGRLGTVYHFKLTGTHHKYKNWRVWIQNKNILLCK